MDETFNVVAVLAVGASADVGAESLVVVESVGGGGGDETSSSSAELDESEVGDDDGELPLGDGDGDGDDLGEWVGALPLLLLLGEAAGADDGDDDDDDDGDNDGDECGDEDGDEDGELLGDVAPETKPTKATKRRATTITWRAILFIYCFILLSKIYRLIILLRIAVFSLQWLEKYCTTYGIYNCEKGSFYSV